MLLHRLLKLPPRSSRGNSSRLRTATSTLISFMNLPHSSNLFIDIY